MGMWFYLQNKRIKARHIDLNVKWSDHYIDNIAKKYNIEDPVKDKYFDKEKLGNGTLILSYRTFLQRLKLSLKNEKSLTKENKEALKRIEENIRNINRNIKGRNLNNWYLSY